MPGLAPTQPQPQELAAHTVGSPVSATSFAQIAASQANFALARALPVVASLSPHMLALTSDTVNFPLQWWPSPGCRLARITVVLAGARYINVIGRVFTDRSAIQANLTAPTGAVRIIGAGAGGPLDGIASLIAADPLSCMRPMHECDISLGEAGDVADAIHDVTLTLSVTAPEQHQGIAEITLTEHPLTALYPERGEVGLALSAFDPRNEITDPSPAVGAGRVGNGTVDILTAEQDTLRTRWHWQIATYEHTSYAWTRASATIGQIDWVGSCGSGIDPVFRVRVPAIYGTSAGTPATFIVRVRYNSTGSPTLRVVRKVVGGGTSNFDFPLPTTGGAWDTDNTPITLRTDGTGQELDLSFHAATDDGSPVYISSIAIIQNEAP